MSFLFTLSRPFLQALPPETAHNLTVNCLKCGMHPKLEDVPDPSIAIEVAGLKFRSPLGLAAGFDKNAECMKAMFKMGMGFTEAGTVTPEPQEGNERPRVFRNSHDRAVINRMGFPNRGADYFHKNIVKFLREREDGQILGINIGKNKDTSDPFEDYVVLIKRFGALADYIAVNVSSPNTPGLRDLQKVEFLEKLIDHVALARDYFCSGTNKPPVFFKFAPDLDAGHLKEIAQLCLEKSVDGVILTNTTLARPEHLPDDFRKEAGGLSGAPVFNLSTEVIRQFYRHTKGQVPIIGVGGILSVEDAYTKIKAGASLVQVYSGLIFKGPELIDRINERLPDLLTVDGYKSIKEAIGQEAG